jgi:hypothetical protein
MHEWVFMKHDEQFAKCRGRAVIRKNVRPVILFVLITIAAAGMSTAQTAPSAGSKPKPAAAAEVVLPSQPQSTDQSDKAQAQPQAESPLDRELLAVRQQFETEALNRMRYGNDSDLDRIMRDLVPFSVFLVIVFVLLWVLRVALDNRRWYRMVRVQTEVHTKLLDRFASSQELASYMESDAGKRFLEAPRFDTQTGQPASFPLGRIIWSVQAGLIAGALGCGLLSLRGKLPNGNSPLLVFGTLALMLGLGFILSAVASYFLARHFGLMAPKSEPGPTPPVRQGLNI